VVSFRSCVASSVTCFVALVAPAEGCTGQSRGRSANSPEGKEGHWRASSGPRKPVTPCEGTSGLREGSASVATAAPPGLSSAPGRFHCPAWGPGGLETDSQTGLRPRPPVEPSTPVPGLLTRVDVGPTSSRSALDLPSVAPHIEGRSDRGEVRDTQRGEDHAEQAMATLRRGQGAARPGLRSFSRSRPGSAERQAQSCGQEEPRWRPRRFPLESRWSPRAAPAASRGPDAQRKEVSVPSGPILGGRHRSDRWPSESSGVGARRQTPQSAAVAS
jgi:hypothetical protein